MKINNARLKGFVGIKKGLGLDEVSVDLSDVSGLVAFDGPNGKGKTTLLENLQPYRTLASRKGSLQHHTFLRESEKELSFSFQGDEYQTLIKIDSESGRQEGFIWRNGQPQVNGKVSAYDDYIEELLGSHRLFFNSVFCAQNSDKLSDMTTGELKMLFSEFLRLDKYIEYEETAKRAVKILLGKKSTLQEEIRRHEANIEKHAGTNDKLIAAKKGLAEADHKIDQLEKTIFDLREEVKEMEKSIEKNTILSRQIERLTKSKADIETERERGKMASEKELSALRTKIAGIDKEIKNHEALLAGKDKLEKDAAIYEAKKNILEQKLDDRDKAYKALETATASYNEAKERFADIRAQIKDIVLDPRVSSLQHKIETTEKNTKTLEKRDPDCISKSCSFIVAALEADGKLPALRRELEDIQTEISIKTADLERKAALLDGALESLADKVKIHGDVRIRLTSEVNGLAREVDAAAKAQSALGQIKSTEEKLAMMQGLRNEVIQTGLDAKNRWDETNKTMMERLFAIDDEEKEILAQMIPGIGRDVMICEAKTKDAEQDLERIVKDQKALISEIGNLEQSQKIMMQAREELTRLKEKDKSISGSAAEWSYIQNACGKDGLRALEIDSVSPLITRYSNDLLSSTFGSDFSIKFQTQDEQGREALDIIVIREDGSETFLENLSGGQKIWNLKALRLALTLVSKEKSGRNFLTALCDEEDGSLDVSNAVNFIDLYRAFMASGGFESCFYISHKPECVAMADRRIVFNGGIRVE